MQQVQRIKVEEKLCSKFDRRYSFIVGSGTLAILIAIKSLGINKGEVIIPTFTCPNVFYAVILSGLTPVFCDINKDDFTIDISSLKNTLSPKTKVILPVHKFGYPANMDEIGKICKENKLYLIEDVAQAMGGKYRSRVLGSFGDISIFSFGYSKIIDIGCGGAILTNNQAIARNISILKKGLTSNNTIASIKSSISKKIFLEWNLEKPFVLKILKLIPYLLKYNISESHLKKINGKLGELDETVEKRNSNSELYKKYLQHPCITHPTYNNMDGVVWRYNILLNNKYKRDNIIHILSENSIFASRLYTPLSQLFSSNQAKLRYNNAVFISKTIVNLIVDPDRVNNNIIIKTSKLILDAVKNGKSIQGI